MNLEAFADDITDTKPDLYYGSDSTQIDPRPREDLSRFIVPLTQQGIPILWNLLCRRKGFWCRFFCCWTTSLLWRHIKRPCDPPDPIILSRSYDNKAYTINFTYQNGMLTMYITHPTPSSHAGRSTEYHMNRLRPYLLTDTLESFRAGAAAVRNACIWAKRQRNLFIESANETAQAVPSNVSFEASTRTKVPGESSWNRCKARLVSVVLSQI